MARPSKKRRICALPQTQGLIPRKDKDSKDVPIITMTVDEYETIRLIDLRSFTQEECAASMEVARTTVQSIYDNARHKLAQCLCNGWELEIEGGNYFLCEGRDGGCQSPHCRKEEPYTMKIAVTYENGQVFQHFGRTEQFKIYQISNGEIVEEQIIGTDGNSHGALAEYLRALGVTTLICGGLGEGARTALTQAGIQVYAGVSGDADFAAANLLTGALKQNTDATCQHHGEGEAAGHDEQHGCQKGNCHS